MKDVLKYPLHIQFFADDGAQLNWRRQKMHGYGYDTKLFLQMMVSVIPMRPEMIR